MIRMVQRRLIIPRGDTGSFSIPYLKKINQGDVAVFTIFDVMTHTKLFQKIVAAEGDVLNVAFSHNETVNLQPGKYLWDIKIYTNPQFVDDELVNGEEIDSYYAGFSLPECEIRETGDSLLMSDDTPQAKLAPDQIDLISAAITATQTAKEVAMNSATDAETSASAAASSAQVALDSKDAALASQTSAATSESNAAESAAAAQESATRAAQIAQQIHEEIPTKVSDLVDDSGHYTKPATGIPASDLEETYLTEHQDLSNYVQFTDYASADTAGVVKVNNASGLYITQDGEIKILPAAPSTIMAGNDFQRPITVNRLNLSTFFGLARAAGLTDQIMEGNDLNYTSMAKAAIQAMLGVPSISDIPTNVSQLQNDAGYLTQHQDISGKANSADLATVAISGSYEDLEDKPTIPEVPVQDVQINGTSILDNGIANVPMADSTTLGVIKVRSDLDVNRLSDGSLTTLTSTMERIKTGTYRYSLIKPVNQHASVFYGLAKVAGHDEKDSTEPFGTYTPEAKTAIQNMLDVPSNAAMTTAIGNAISNINSFDMAVVQELPTEDISTHTIYLVPKTGETNDVYDEYVYINNAWEMVGNTQIDLSNYVQFSDYASNTTAGVVKVDQNFGVAIATYGGSVGKLGIVKATDINIKAGEGFYTPIVPSNQHKSVFYGLAKAAGDTTQSASDNAVGTYTDEAKAAIRSMIGAVGTEDKANSSTLGLVKVNGNGIAIDSGGAIYLAYAGDASIKGGNSTYSAITTTNQHKSVFYGLAKVAGDTTMASSSNTVGIYTDNAKASIKAMLGIQDGSTGTVDITGTTPSITAVENTRYVCGEVSTLSFTPAASGICIVRFTSGSTATVLTVPNTVKFPEWFDITALEADTIYEICITDGIYGAVMSWAL